MSVTKTMLVATVSALALTALATTGRAQEKEEKTECVCPSWGEVRVWPHGDFSRVWIQGRGRLGIYVRSEANAETDAIGAYVTGVVEGGPADEAGIEEGDIITRLGGESLTGDSEGEDEARSVPGMRLVERARALEVGDTVEVGYVRDGETRTARVVAGEFSSPFTMLWADSLSNSPRIQGMLRRFRELPEVRFRGPETFAFRLGALLPGLELASLNPELGEYFGAEDGVLVVSVPEDGELGLRAGDVIQSIDGRAVRSPSHAMRILRSYEPDEEVTFEVIRKERRITVSGKVGGRIKSGDYDVRIRQY